MKERNIEIGDNAPIWAWVEPKEKIQQLADELLSGMQWQQGVAVLELQAPRSVALLSSYFYWNEILSNYLDTKVLTPEHQLLVVDDLDEDDNIQVVLPYIKQEWVKDTHSLEHSY